MRVFVAGATGAVGRRLVPLALRVGHQVTGMTRSEERAGALRAAGAEAVVADALNRAAVVAAVAKAKPEVVVHQLTALSSFTNLRRFDRQFEATNLLRTQGTTNLIAAARAADAHRLVAQSFAGWPYARSGGRVKTEEDDLDPDPPAKFQAALDAIRYLECGVLAAEGLNGVVLRYGWFYGPRTSLGGGEIPRGGASAAIPDHRGRHRRVVVHPYRRRGFRHAFSDRLWCRRDLQHR